MSFTGWTIPVEPLFDRHRGSADFQRILTRLADRAR
jgi:hypothetical protein